MSIIDFPNFQQDASDDHESFESRVQEFIESCDYQKISADELYQMFLADNDYDAFEERVYLRAKLLMSGR